jgi:hypothetical protein
MPGDLHECPEVAKAARVVDEVVDGDLRAVVRQLGDTAHIIVERMALPRAARSPPR